MSVIGAALAAMAEPSHAIQYHWFSELRSRWVNRSAASAIPLVMWQDVIRTGANDNANFHHDFFSLYVVRRGRGTHVIDGVPYGVARGDVYAMGPGMVHHFEGCHDLLADTLHFSPAVFDSATLDALGETPGFHELFITSEAKPGENRWLHLTPAGYEEVAGLLAELTAEWSSDTPDGTLLVPGLFLRLLVRLSRQRAVLAASGNGSALPPVFSAGGHEAAIAAAVRFMDENFAQPLRMEQIAALAFLSPHRFTEVFSQAMGRTPRDYLRHLRIERAKTLLSTTNATIAEIAEQVGLGDAAYLTRVLRDATGQTPGAFRKKG